MTIDRSGKRMPPFARFLDATGAHVDLGSAGLAESFKQHFKEDLAERMRKLYVALTRARLGCHVYGNLFARRFGQCPDHQIGELDVWLGAALDDCASEVTLAEDVTPADRALAGWQALAERTPGMQLVLGYNSEFTRLQGVGASTEQPRAARSGLPLPRPYRGIYSFTALSRRGPPQSAVAEPGAEDESAPLLAAPPIDADGSEGKADPDLLLLDRWRGPRFGDGVHALFEQRELGLPLTAQRALVERELREHTVIRADDAPAQVLVTTEAIAGLVDRVLAADLGGGLRLADLSAASQRAEFEFCFALERTQLPPLRRLLAEHGGGDWLPPRANDDTLLGLMTGYIDLVFAWDRRFHVLDYKSNRLGDSLDDYADAALDAAMREHLYPLQALIYTVAVHRYLRTRIADYELTRDLGDCWYLFVRAVGLAPAAGVWRRRFPRELIEGVDHLFAGGS